MSEHRLFATCPVYLEELLKEEVLTFGGKEPKVVHGGVEFQGSLESAYSICLWSRTANRLLLPVLDFEAIAPEDIKKAVEEFAWEDFFNLTSSIAVTSTISKSKICTPDYSALLVKDGIVDRARNLTGTRPAVDTKNPDARLHLHIRLKQASVSIDLSGEPLHRRGYRLSAAKAAVRENTAAAVLMRAGWNTFTAEESCRPFLDPMCGSGTLLIEAAMIAADMAPAIDRKYFGFMKLKNFQAPLWEKIKAAAQKRRAEGLEFVRKCSTPLFYGRDSEGFAVRTAINNIKASPAADLWNDGYFDISKADFFKDDKPVILHPGLLAVNPPYGERLGKDQNMLMFYGRLGEHIKNSFPGWNISILTGDRQLSEATGLKADKINTVYNGGIRCSLSHFRIYEKQEDTQIADGAESASKKPENNTKKTAWPSFEELSPGAQMLYNRLKKNSKNLKKWLKNTGLECYRLYDADMPEYSVAVDIYPPNAVVQEYAPPKTIDPVAAAGRLREALSAVSAYLELPEKSVILKQRKRQKGSSQYTKKDENRYGSQKLIIKEHGLKFLIDLNNYLDTGIFLDSRPLRMRIRELADGKTFLNLFCYTGTASVYAAAGGAYATTSVDTSRTYLDWAEENMKLNKFDSGNHSFVREDCMKWLESSIGEYDLIFLDPPTFSNSKDRDDIFDIQRDHVNLIRLTASRLSSDGTLIFCNNYRKFQMDEELSSDLDIKEISEQTIDPDFKRNYRIHRSWKIKHRK